MPRIVNLNPLLWYYLYSMGVVSQTYIYITKFYLYGPITCAFLLNKYYGLLPSNNNRKEHERLTMTTISIIF